MWFHTEVSKESGLREDQEEPWRRVPRLGPTAGMQDRGRPFDARSCAHAGLDPTKILGRRGGRLHQGQKLDLDRAEYRAKGEELHRAQVLGAWIFRLDGGPRRETIRAHIRSFWIGRWINLRRSHSPITKVAESFQTAFSNSPPYHRPSWWLLTWESADASLCHRWSTGN